jgi:hypothetical protein
MVSSLIPESAGEKSSREPIKLMATTKTTPIAM